MDDDKKMIETDILKIIDWLKEKTFNDRDEDEYKKMFSEKNITVQQPLHASGVPQRIHMLDSFFHSHKKPQTK